MPPLHPILVHFPIALIIIGAILELIAWVWNKSILHRAGVVNLVVGTVFAIPVIITGLDAEEAVFTIDPVHKILEIHETLAFISLGILLVLSIWAIIGFRRWEERAPLVFVIAILIAAGFLGATGYFGGEMVYKHGVAVTKDALGPASDAIFSGQYGYRCPVHRNLASAKPGLCPQCGVRMIPILNLPTPKDAKKQQADSAKSRFE